LTQRGALPREAPARQPLCADIDGFSLHAAVRVDPHERKRLEQLCHYIARPALSEERIQLDAAGQVQLELGTPWRDGTTHLVMSPLEFMQRLAALVARPRLHLIRFHGVLATEDHRGHPAATGDREDPDAPGPGPAAPAQGPGARGAARLKLKPFGAGHAPATSDSGRITTPAAQPGGSCRRCCAACWFDAG